MIDVVRVHALGNSYAEREFNFRDWTSLRVLSSMVGPSEASFELGDDTGWERLLRLCDLGARFAVLVNDRPRLVGRVEAITAPIDAEQSATQSFIVRTRLSDAMYASAPQGIRLKGASIKQFVLACYEAVGLGEADFDFVGDVSRDLLTGKDTKGGKPKRILEPLKEEQQKVNPPETVFAAVDRHLRRHGFLQWDGPDGRIVIASPDDQQAPMARLLCRQPPHGQQNNVVSIERTRDVSQSPTTLSTFGVGGSADFRRTRVSSILYNQDLIRRGFRRGVVINDEGLKTKELAGARGNREFATRNRGLDRLTVTVDGLSYRDGNRLVPWAPDTTVDIFTHVLGGAMGIYFTEEVEMTRSDGSGDLTRLSLVKQGVWVL